MKKEQKLIPRSLERNYSQRHQWGGESGGGNKE